jgi:hypothetical protein
LKERTKLSGAEILARTLSPLIQHRNVKGLTWLEGCLLSDPRVLDSFDQNVVDEFRERVSTELEKTSDDEAHDRVVKIASLLGIERQISRSEKNTPQ